MSATFHIARAQQEKNESWSAFEGAGSNRSLRPLNALALLLFNNSAEFMAWRVARSELPRRVSLDPLWRKFPLP